MQRFNKNFHQIFVSPRGFNIAKNENTKYCKKNYATRFKKESNITNEKFTILWLEQKQYNGKIHLN